MEKIDEIIEKLPFELNGYQFTSYVGRGSYSVVFEVLSKRYQMQRFAAKMSPIDENFFSEDRKSILDPELGALLSLDHPNIIKFYDYFLYEEYLILILDFCANGTLETLISDSDTFSSNMSNSSPKKKNSNCSNSFNSNNNGGNNYGIPLTKSNNNVMNSANNYFSYNYNNSNGYNYSSSNFSSKNGICFDFGKTMSLFNNIVKGLSCCHGSGIAHRDLKPNNIFVDHHQRAIVGDFGLASFETRLVDKACGTPFYCAPEIFENMPYDPFSADIFALGVTIYQLITKKLPFTLEELQNSTKVENNSEGNRLQNKLNYKLTNNENNENKKKSPVDVFSFGEITKKMRSLVFMNDNSSSNVDYIGGVNDFLSNGIETIQENGEDENANVNSEVKEDKNDKRNNAKVSNISLAAANSSKYRGFLSRSSLNFSHRRSDSIDSGRNGKDDPDNKKMPSLNNNSNNNDNSNGFSTSTNANTNNNSNVVVSGSTRIKIPTFNSNKTLLGGRLNSVLDDSTEEEDDSMRQLHKEVENLIDLIARMLSRNPKERPTIKQIEESGVFQGRFANPNSLFNNSNFPRKSSLPPLKAYMKLGDRAKKGSKNVNSLIMSNPVFNNSGNSNFLEKNGDEGNNNHCNNKSNDGKGSGSDSSTNEQKEGERIPLCIAFGGCGGGRQLGIFKSATRMRTTNSISSRAQSPVCMNRKRPIPLSDS